MLKTIETILTEHQPFGDSDYIHRRLLVCYQRRLRKISTYLPVASQLLIALNKSPIYKRHQAIGDTVVRCAIQHALKQLETGTPYGFTLKQCEEIFRATIHHLAKDKPGGPLEAGLHRVNRLGTKRYHGWIWSEKHSDDVFGRSFRQLIEDNYGESLCTPTNDEVANLKRGAKLLEYLLPTLSCSALSHSHLIGIFPAVGTWKGKASSSQFRISGSIFIARDVLQSPWQVAEYLFHESLHQKLYDFRHGHSLLEPNYWRQGAPTVCSLWNVPNTSNCWDTHRAVVAFHVYVHLSLLSTVAEQQEADVVERYEPVQGSLKMIESRRAFERAHYLGEQIKELCWKELGRAGKGLIDWLTSVLYVLDPAPPPKDCFLHLLLDLYQRDTQQVEAVLGQADLPSARSDFPRQLMDLIDNDVKSTRHLLSAAGAKTVLGRFNNALCRCSDTEFGKKFSDVRTLILKTLLELSPDGYRLKGSKQHSTNLDEIVKQMIQISSRRVDRIIAAYQS